VVDHVFYGLFVPSDEEWMLKVRADSIPVWRMPFAIEGGADSYVPVSLAVPDLRKSLSIADRSPNGRFQITYQTRVAAADLDRAGKNSLPGCASEKEYSVGFVPRVTDRRQFASHGRRRSQLGPTVSF
jgi:hypothetical protein